MKNGTHEEGVKKKIKHPVECIDKLYRPIIYNYIIYAFILAITRLPVTRWVKLSLNFELLVPK